MAKKKRPAEPALFPVEKTFAPPELSAVQLRSLEESLHEMRPWLLDEKSVELAPHCNVGWVRAQIEETLAYWASREDKDAMKSARAWVATVLNRILREDTLRWERLGAERPIPTIVRRTARFSPLLKS